MEMSIKKRELSNKVWRLSNNLWELSIIAGRLSNNL